MEKLKMHSPNLTQDNIARIRDLFPGCVTEAKGEDGSVRLAVDFDQLRQELAESIVEGPQERYHLNWPGKREALLAANAPIAKTLRPCREESVDFDTTKNLFIEGDNLDALKLLQETYLGKVKMIYIDPPYNTGNDFIYEDDYTEEAGNFLRRSNQKDEIGNKLVANMASNGRFHSAWLGMMFSRLRLAKNLLSQDGVIFISIDDGEQACLKIICDEIYSADNFVGQLIRKTIEGGKQDSLGIQANHEYCLVYHGGDVSGVGRKKLENFDHYVKSDGYLKDRGRYYLKPLENGGLGYVPSLDYPILGPDGVEIYPGGVHGDNGYRWVWGRDRLNNALKLDLVEFVKARDGNGYKVYYKIYERFNSDGETVERTTPFGSLYLDGFTNRQAVLEVKAMFDDKRLIDYPKPTSFLAECVRLGASNGGIVLDFFAGSSTTADAVMRVNSEDGANRSFIMIQIPQDCDNKSEAFKSGYKTIAEISKERIRRAGRKILEGTCHENWNRDVGLRVLKIDTSNMADVYYTPDSLDKAKFDLFVDNIKPDRTPEDLLFQVMLDWGVDLALPITKQSIQGKDVFFVDGNALAACFDASGSIDEAFVKELAKHQPLRVVFRDAGYKNSAVKINVEQIFKLLSPATEVKCI